jgi:ABC-2 type transport system permease protein/oleandomycin transport system permease protein
VSAAVEPRLRSDPSRPSPLAALGWAAADALVLTKRNLIRYIRIPSLLAFSSIQPVILVVLFSQVFGGAIRLPAGIDYIDYLVPGVIVQATLFGTLQTGVGLAKDVTEGLIDRFRSLPMARSAVLLGRTLADMIRNVVVVVLMIGVGHLFGFRFHTDVLHAVGLVGLAAFFAFAFSWISAAIALWVRDVESAQTAGFLWLFPLIFASSAFVPIATMPGWLRAFAEVSPITAAVDGLRALVLGGPTAGSVLGALAWTLAILAVFVPIAVWRFRRA